MAMKIIINDGYDNILVDIGIIRHKWHLVEC